MTDELIQQKIHTFLDSLASNAPTPGGGSVAALSGAMSAGLVSMVCALTIGKKQFAEFESEIRAVYEQAEQLRHEFQELAQQDIVVFNNLSSAYKLPRITESDAANRQAAIQKITREAADVPLRTARTAARVLPLCTALANRCSRMIVSDIGVAALLARATVQSALLNVEINLAALDDKHYVRDIQSQIADLSIGLSEETTGIVTIVRTRINQ